MTITVSLKKDDRFYRETHHFYFTSDSRSCFHVQLQDLFTETQEELTTTKEELTQTCQTLEETETTLKTTKSNLYRTRKDRDEQKHLVTQHVKTETKLYEQAAQVLAFRWHEMYERSERSASGNRRTFTHIPAAWLNILAAS